MMTLGFLWERKGGSNGQTIRPDIWPRDPSRIFDHGYLTTRPIFDHETFIRPCGASAASAARGSGRRVKHSARWCVKYIIFILFDHVYCLTTSAIFGHGLGCLWYSSWLCVCVVTWDAAAAGSRRHSTHICPAGARGGGGRRTGSAIRWPYPTRQTGICQIMSFEITSFDDVFGHIIPVK